MISNITTSQLASVDPVFALYGGIRARAEAIRKEWAFCSQSTKRNVANENFVHEAIQAIAVLHQMEGRLDNPSFVPHVMRDHGEHLACAAGALATVDAKRDATQVAVTQEVRKQFLALGTSTQQKQRIFGLEGRERVPTSEWWLQDVMTELKSNGARARLADHKWRMIEEIEHRAAQGWYIVFNTLTVSNTNYKEVFSKGSQSWRNYVHMIDNAVGSEIHGNVRKAEFAKASDPFHSYFGVVERGSRHGRLHIHVIHCMKAIPACWKRDPNRVNGPSTKREIVPMKKFWRYGHSVPIACRFADSDAFGRLGWCWPTVREGNRFVPIPRKPPIAIARYMCKYILKAYEKPLKKGVFTWRTRISHGFGLTRMRDTIATIDRLTLWTFLSETPKRISVNDRILPNERLRIECLRSLLKPMRNGQPESGESLSQLRMIRKSLMAVTPRQPIAERLRSLRMMTPNCSLPSITISAQLLSNDTAAFNVSKIFREAFRRPVTRFTSFGGTPRH